MFELCQGRVTEEESTMMIMLCRTATGTTAPTGQASWPSWRAKGPATSCPCPWDEVTRGLYYIYIYTPLKYTKNGGSLGVGGYLLCIFFMYLSVSLPLSLSLSFSLSLSLSLFPSLSLSLFFGCIWGSFGATCPCQAGGPRDRFGCRTNHAKLQEAF